MESPGSWILHSLRLHNQMGSSELAPAGSPAAQDAVGELLAQRHMIELAAYLYPSVALKLEHTHLLS